MRRIGPPEGLNFMRMRPVKNNHILLLALLLVTCSCRHKKDLVKGDVKKNDVKSGIGNPVREKLGLSEKEIRESKLYRFVNEWYGVPYKYGGCQKSGVDCSCFTNNLYEQVYGHKTARTAGEIFRNCDKVSMGKIRQGDLLFFIINGKSVSHVGVYLRDNKFVHASTSKGVIISDLDEPYYKKYFHSAGRIKLTL
jgi:hypothetical protein